MAHATASHLSHPSSSIHIPGPVDRTSFFAEQQRNRRATWQLFLACVVAIGLMGIPLCFVITPLVFAVLLFGIHVVDLVIPQPGLLEALGSMGQSALSGVVYVLDLLTGESSQEMSSHPYLGFALFLFPGIAVITGLWRSVYSLFLQGGVEGVLLCLEARAPRIADLEEQQLVNLIEEMSLAAGVQTPRVTLLKVPVANAAAIGTSPADATIIISRALLDEFDRNETQAVIGHLIGGIGNGDLRIAFMTLSVFLTFALLINVLSAPFSPHSRGILRQILRFGWSPKRRHVATQEENELIQVLLAQGLGSEKEDDCEKAMATPLGKILMPVIFSAISAKMTLFVFITFLVGPLLALLWRTRRYLADATTVQLTRDPESLARALTGLATKGGMVPGTQSIAHLFVINHKAVQQQKQAVLQKMMAERQQRGHIHPSAEEAAEVRSAWKETLQASATTTKESLAESLGGVSFLSFHPSLPRRLARLRALGATIDGWQPLRFWQQWRLDTWDRLWTIGPGKGILVICLLLLLVVLVPVAVVGLFLVVAMLTMVNLMFMGFLLLGIHGTFTLLIFLKAWLLS